MGTQPKPNSHFGLGRSIEGQVENFQLPQNAKNIAIFDDFDCPKIPTLQPRIGSPNGLQRIDAGAMKNYSMWFGGGRVSNGEVRCLDADWLSI
jgi:hypothetical protein